MAMMLLPPWISGPGANRSWFSVLGFLLWLGELAF